MLTHSQIWAALDALAEREGLSPSSLAKRAGLDPTTFNRSKRKNATGQLRWPSTESIAKVLAATDTSIDDFLHLIVQGEPSVRRIPFHTLDASLRDAFDRNGRPSLQAWDQLPFPSPEERQVFALEVRGNDYLPTFRDGAIVIVAPEAETRRGDRVLVLDKEGPSILAVLGHQTTAQVHLSTLTGESLPPRATDSLKAVYRIIWASQ
ncbi:MAG: helix-turn-helix transcriptional regulator [Proteobacteria bacterium]|nr:helix-turn-helix transcriptional regulator [Pseudomonadota bacterium]